MVAAILDILPWSLISWFLFRNWELRREIRRQEEVITNLFNYMEKHYPTKEKV